jgi:zinc D-Ala-D-Ala dipeptidase
MLVNKGAVFFMASLSVTAMADTPPTISPATTMTAAGMIDVRSLAPDIAEDIKYASSDNFTGAAVPGYRSAKCFLLTPAAQALTNIEQNLRKQHLGLKIWDCYRPAQSVAAFVRWAHDLQDQRTKAAHYPNLGKDQLLGEYIAETSNHTRGATVDLTMMECDARDKHCHELDMGTPFDLFDPRAHTDSQLATPAQRANRQRLLQAMAAQGFENYADEWWHYTLTLHPQPTILYDVPVQ